MPNELTPTDIRIGGIYTTVEGKVVMVLSDDCLQGYYRCDDGWVRPAEQLRVATAAQQQKHAFYMAIADARIADFEKWLKEE